MVVVSSVIDVHTHIGTDLGEDLAQTVEELISGLAAAGVGRAVVSTFEGGPRVADGNDDVMRAAAAAPDTLIPFVVFIPTESPRVRARFVPALRDWATAEAPVRGVVINPTMHPCDLLHPEVRAVLAACDDLGLAVMLHYMAQWSDAPDGGAELAKGYPDITFLVPAVAWVPGALGLFADLDNVFVDVGKNYGRMTIRTILNAVGPDRVLFGSDSPRLDIAHELRKLEESSLSEDELRRIKYANASTLFAAR